MKYLSMVERYLPMTVSPGNYELLLNGRDIGNNKVSFKVTLHVVEDFSPDDR